MDSVKFYWESLNQVYKFDPNKQYLIYFRGCFCPGTVGHFNTIADFTYLDNANFFIHQGGSEKRHGVPYELSRKIWKIYIQELLPSHKLALVKWTKKRDKELVEHRFTQEADTVVFLVGNEGYIPEDHEKYSKEVKYKSSIKALIKAGKEVVFLFLNRPKLNTISATKLCQTIMNGGSIDQIRFFLPKELSEKGVRYIFRKLKQCNLH